jgi:hypothetical protein
MKMIKIVQYLLMGDHQEHAIPTQTHSAKCPILKLKDQQTQEQTLKG